jgi:hypothetical protein
MRKGFLGNPEKMRPVQRQRKGCDNNIKMEVKEIWCEEIQWLRTGTSGMLL